MRRKKIALVIGTGSVKCAATLGVLRVLWQAGIQPDLVVGCSSGALYATVVALGLEVETAVCMTRQLWTKGVTGKRNNRAVRGDELFLPYGDSVADLLRFWSLQIMLGAVFSLGTLLLDRI